MKSLIAFVGALLALSGGEALSQQSEKPKYSADVPSSIKTPDSVSTSIGTLKFDDGVPDKTTVGLVYDQLDLSRGIETFMQGVPATSVYAVCRGMATLGSRKIKGSPSPKT